YNINRVIRLDTTILLLPNGYKKYLFKLKENLNNLSIDNNIKYIIIQITENRNNDSYCNYLVIKRENNNYRIIYNYPLIFSNERPIYCYINVIDTQNY